jgi:hypothetical protein
MRCITDGLLRAQVRWVLCVACLSLVSFELRAADPVLIEFDVEGGRVVGGTRVIRLARNDSVRLVVRSEKPDELHLHGYNLRADVGPTRPVVLNFIASRTGRFNAELHRSGVELGVLEIYPK